MAIEMEAELELHYTFKKNTKVWEKKCKFNLSEISWSQWIKFGILGSVIGIIIYSAVGCERIIGGGEDEPICKEIVDPCRASDVATCCEKKYANPEICIKEVQQLCKTR
jgi:hypothetical protein